MSTVLSSPADDCAAESLRTIGVMVCLYVQLELAMRRLIEVLAYPADEHDTTSLAARHRFQPPLRSLRILILTRYANEPLKTRKFRRWRNRVNKMLDRRNTLVHGSWIDAAGRLHFSRYPRCVGAKVNAACIPISAERVARDMRWLAMDIATIKAWIQYHESLPRR
jgi:hypothetical protein